MEIALVLDDSLDKADGVQQYVLTLGKWLAEQGTDVHYLVGSTDRQDVPNIHSISRNIPVRFNHNYMSIPLPVRAAAIQRVFDEHHFDVLHVQMPYSPMFAAKLIKQAPPETAVVGTFHIAPYSKKEQLASSMLGRWLRPTLNQFDRIISASTAAQEFAKKRFKINSTVVPNLVDEFIYSKGRELKKYADGKTNIVFLGRLMPRKGCEFLLKAINKLHLQGRLTGCRVIICGKGPLLPKLEQYVQDKGLSEVVEFTGFVAERDKPDYYASADIAVFPSTGGESFGIVLIEAMSAGAGVVIGGNNAGYTTVLGSHPETLFDPTDISGFAKVLDKFIKKDTERRRLGEKQHAEAKQYDVSVVGPKIIDIYKEAIAIRRSNTDN